MTCFYDREQKVRASNRDVRMAILRVVTRTTIRTFVRKWVHTTVRDRA